MSGQGKLLVSSSNLGEVGGEAAVALTSAQGPVHKHTRITVGGLTSNAVYWGDKSQSDIKNAWGYNYGPSGENYLDTNYAGEGKPHNNMPPYARMIAHVRAA